MSTADIISYGGAIVASALYSLFLERLERRYEPRWTWLTVMGGIALTGACVALRFWLGHPALPPSQLIWWAWWVMTGMFVATGIPVIAWQFWQESRRADETRNYVLGQHREEGE